MFYCGEFAEGRGPGIDENYWGKRNRSTMSQASLAVFQQSGSFTQFPQQSQQTFRDRSQQGISDWSQHQGFADQHRIVHPQPQQRRETYGVDTAFQNQREQIAWKNYEQALRQARGDVRTDYQHGGQQSRYQPPVYVKADQQPHYQQSISAGDQQTRYQQSVSSSGDHRTQYQQTTSPNARTVVVTRTGPGYRDQVSHL
ncbi:unnamed protein product [Strongylus vulgaris]|uniref:Uncharacterized protein n=1 Tax=Strongylus vulgaris TaxID=40348 RepID=A0A3P7JPZ9_STRVU|nr:unnamed protein product [Strongylus vulgaris]